VCALFTICLSVFVDDDEWVAFVLAANPKRIRCWSISNPFLGAKECSLISSVTGRY